jgi:tRNA threonylcarbamoyladenosine biosynthesis protein TsaE
MLQLCAESLDDTGEMGAGKTAFAQGFGRSLGVTEPITSPTFTLVRSYPCGKLTLHHADLYRLERTTELADLALAELAEDRGVVLVEWGDVVGDALGEHLVVLLGFDDESEDRRLIEIHGVGGSWAGRWSRLVEACEAYAC